jgi:hypothetical protein
LRNVTVAVSGRLDASVHQHEETVTAITELTRRVSLER